MVADYLVFAEAIDLALKTLVIPESEEHAESESRGRRRRATIGVCGLADPLLEQKPGLRPLPAFEEAWDEREQLLEIRWLPCARNGMLEFLPRFRQPLKPDQDIDFLGDDGRHVVAGSRLAKGVLEFAGSRQHLDQFELRAGEVGIGSQQFVNDRVRLRQAHKAPERYRALQMPMRPGVAAYAIQGPIPVRQRLRPPPPPHRNSCQPCLGTREAGIGSWHFAEGCGGFVRSSKFEKRLGPRRGPGWVRCRTGARERLFPAAQRLGPVALSAGQGSVRGGDRRVGRKALHGLGEQSFRLLQPPRLAQRRAHSEAPRRILRESSLEGCPAAQRLGPVAPPARQGGVGAGNRPMGRKALHGGGEQSFCFLPPPRFAERRADLKILLPDRLKTGAGPQPSAAAPRTDCRVERPVSLHAPAG